AAVAAAEGKPEMPAAVQTVDFDVSPSAAMGTLTDFESYPTFLPELKQARILHQEANAWEVQFTLQMIRPLVYTLRLHQPSPLALQWSLVEGVFRANAGGWVLQPIDDGARTAARYTIEIQLGMFVPANIIRSLVSEDLPRTMSRFKAEVERRVR
ncbi:MAG: SRPBCC family protein, partial [Myxococcota bacterium]